MKSNAEKIVNDEKEYTVIWLAGVLIMVVYSFSE